MIDDDGKKFDMAKVRRRKWTALRERNIRNVVVWRPTKLIAAKADIPIRHDVVGYLRGFQPPCWRHHRQNPMCAWRERNRAPGASLTSPNEGHNPRRAFRPFSPFHLPSLPFSSLSHLFSSVSFLFFLFFASRRKARHSERRTCSSQQALSNSLSVLGT